MTDDHGTDRSDARPDYSELLRSPYDDEHSQTEGESDLPWVPAVVAACVGALAVGAFVVFAVATGPNEPEDEVAVTSSTTASTPEPVRADGPPEGFQPLTDEVAGAVVAVDVSSRGSVLTVATAVSGAEDPDAVEPVDVAFWELRNGGATVPMVEQSIGKLGLGNIAVVFPPQLSLREPELVPFVAVATDDEVTVLELEAELPQDVGPFEIDIADVTISISELSFDDSWGWLAWSASGGPARVDPTITFVGTDDPSAPGENPTQLVPLSRQPFSFSAPDRPLPTPFGFDGAESLVRSGEPVTGGNQPTSVRVELVVTVPSVVEEAAPLPLP